MVDAGASSPNIAEICAVLHWNDAAGNPHELNLQDQAITRHHVRFQKQGTDYILSDLSSANSTILNGEPLKEPTLLNDGDVIVVGETTLLFRNRYRRCRKGAQSQSM